MKHETMIVMILLILCSFIDCKHKDNWAVLVAGSKTYINYRHQADLFHAYKTLIKNGYDKDHIILFAYDDIADNVANPLPGEVFNRPDGSDVYAGVFIDYKGEDLTPENFINVLLGKAKEMKGIGSGKVLQSTFEDNVFIYFADHGNDGVIFFPEETSYLLADEILDAFKEMNQRKMYHHLVFYLESCFSGSVFTDLPKDMNIYAITAADPDENSFATYCGEDAWVRGVDVGICLGDEFSVRWLEDTDIRPKPEEYTLKRQYDNVKILTRRSTVSQYGDLTIAETDTIKDYHYHSSDSLKEVEENELKEEERREEREYKRVSSRDVKLMYLKRMAEKENSKEAIDAYHTEVQLIGRSMMIFDMFKSELGLPMKRHQEEKINYQCLKFTIEIYNDLCGFNERDIEFFNIFSIACSRPTISNLHIYTTLRDICHSL